MYFLCFLAPFVGAVLLTYIGYALQVRPVDYVFLVKAIMNGTVAGLGTLTITATTTMLIVLPRRNAVMQVIAGVIIWFAAIILVLLVLSFASMGSYTATQNQVIEFVKTQIESTLPAPQATDSLLPTHGTTALMPHTNLVAIGQTTDKGPTADQIAETKSCPELIPDDMPNYGRLQIIAGKGVMRTISWDGATASFDMNPRLDCDQIRDDKQPCYVLEFPRREGQFMPAREWSGPYGVKNLEYCEIQSNFKSVDDALKWLHDVEPGGGGHLIYNNDGFYIGWCRGHGRKIADILEVSVGQIYINGEKPTSLPGATDEKMIVGSAYTQ
jgi:hypothetical protein